jgi:hypothetical protein
LVIAVIVDPIALLGGGSAEGLSLEAFGLSLAIAGGLTRRPGFTLEGQLAAVVQLAIGIGKASVTLLDLAFALEAGGRGVGDDACAAAQAAVDGVALK